ncbi:MAG TPA: class I SAM-dependent methyltransferase [Dermatophilaceae bacterium]|nr:class I SAM-dependent methyltransferase [Dermatophilaceae bacterium]
MTHDVDVRREFDSGAGNYDLLVRLNPGYHRNLDAAAAELVQSLGDGRDPGRPVRLVDLGCGSGASTRALLRQLDTAAHPVPPGRAHQRTESVTDIVGLDASPGMLAQARRKSWPPGVRFEIRLAQQLEESVPAGSRDGVFACYLLRNIPPGERDGVLTDVLSRLRPGGVFVAHEYSVAGRLWSVLAWALVCWLVIIPLAVLTRGNPPLYRYLWRSVHQFDSIAHLQDRLRAAGFADVSSRPTTGWSRGILHTVVARRPV